jgi:threonine/homoserine efflux transporter RhtA
MKYLILFVAAVIIEIASTFYISAVSDRQLLPMVWWAFIGPFLGLPFLAYQIEAKNNLDRLKLALCYGVGYATGAALVNILT